MALFGLGKPNTEKLQQRGDVRRLYATLQHRRPEVRQDAFERLLEMAIEPRFRARAGASLSALGGRAHDLAVGRLSERLRGSQTNADDPSLPTVAEALVALGASHVVRANHEALAEGQASASLRGDLASLLTLTAAAEGDLDALASLLADAPPDEERISHDFVFPQLEDAAALDLSGAADAFGRRADEEALLDVAGRTASRTVRTRLWLALGRTGTENALPMLLAGLDEGAPEAEEAIRSLAPRLSVDSLMRLADDGHTFACSRAIVELCARTSHEALPVILAATDDEDDEVAVTAIRALGGLGGGEAIDCLDSVIRSESEARWTSAAIALGAITGPSAVEVMVSLPPERLASRNVLDAIGHAGGWRELIDTVQREPGRFSAAQIRTIVEVLSGYAPVTDLARLQELEAAVSPDAH